MGNVVMCFHYNGLATDSEKDDWISVDDALPAIGEKVDIAIAGKCVANARLSVYGEFIGPLWWREATHWRKKRKPPVR